MLCTHAFVWQWKKSQWKRKHGNGDLFSVCACVGSAQLLHAGTRHTTSVPPSLFCDLTPPFRRVHVVLALFNKLQHTSFEGLDALVCDASSKARSSGTRFRLKALPTGFSFRNFTASAPVPTPTSSMFVSANGRTLTCTPNFIGVVMDGVVAPPPRRLGPHRFRCRWRFPHCHFSHVFACRALCTFDVVAHLCGDSLEPRRSRSPPQARCCPTYLLATLADLDQHLNVAKVVVAHLPHTCVSHQALRSPALPIFP